MKRDAQERGMGFKPTATEPANAQAGSEGDGDAEFVDDFWRGGDAVYLRHLQAHQPSAARSGARLQSRLNGRANRR